MKTVIRTVAFIFVLVSMAPALHAQDRMLTLADVSTTLADLIGGTELDFVMAAEIMYGVTRNRTYDDFFRDSAIAYGGMVIGQGLVDDATENLKGYARDKAAIAELEAQIQEITGGADPEEWTTEQSLAVLKTAEAQDQLSDEERAYMIKTAANIVATIPVVEASVSSSADLVEQVPDLVKGARGAFGIRRAGGVVRNVQRSGDRISEIPSRGAGLIESLIVLREGLSLVNAD